MGASGFHKQQENLPSCDDTRHLTQSPVRYETGEFPSVYNLTVVPVKV